VRDQQPISVEVSAADGSRKRDSGESDLVTSTREASKLQGVVSNRELMQQRSSIGQVRKKSIEPSFQRYLQM
jgi:hypothetical protein